MAFENSKPQHISSIPLIAIDQINSSSEEFLIYNKQTDYIEIMGRLIQESSSAMKTELVIQDYSSTQSVFFFKKNHEEVARALSSFIYIDNGYARIIASLRKVQGSVNLIGLFIENISIRSKVTEFYSRVMVSYIKSIAPASDLRSSIINAIKKLSANNPAKGVKILDIQSMLGDGASESIIEEQCSKMMGEHILSMGVDWNHYKLSA